MRASPVPSVKTLTEIGIDAEKAKLLRSVLTTHDIDRLETIMCRDSNRDLFATSRRRLRSCYNKPDVEEMQLEMANDVVAGFGVEHCGEVDMRDGPPLLYVNLGDAYDTTLCLFRGRFVVSSWGDIVERHPKLFE